jgi:hypothetical protein
MAVPTPIIPTFTDGMIVHSTDLNALASNITNLYTYNQTGFQSQKPAVIATQTTGQNVATGADTLVTFQAASINTDNMFTASVPDHITIQHAGIYLIIGTVPYPTLAGTATPTMGMTANIWVNGTTPSNAVVGADIPAINSGGGAGPTPVAVTLQNLAVGATVYLDAYQTSGGTQTLRTSPYGASLMAMFLTPST